MTTKTDTASSPLVEDVRAAMRKAFQLGQTYWQQADSESVSQNAKSDETATKFRQLVTDTCTALAAGIVQPAAQVSGMPDLARSDAWRVGLTGVRERLVGCMNPMGRESHYNNGSNNALRQAVAEIDEVLAGTSPGMKSAATLPAAPAPTEQATFDRRWSLARDGFGLQRDDAAGNYVAYDDAVAVIHAALAARPAPASTLTQSRERDQWTDEQRENHRKNKALVYRCTVCCARAGEPHLPSCSEGQGICGA